MCIRDSLVSTLGQPQVETREMGVQYEDGGEQVNLIATDNRTFGEQPIVEAVSTAKTNQLYVYIRCSTLMLPYLGVIALPWRIVDVRYP